jgi:DNA repair protein RadA/Sms
MPRRAVVGWDPNRLSMVLAVLEAHGGIRLGGHDVYLNVAGGLRISEPAADLAVAAALVSSLSGAALPSDSVYFGELGLSGAVRPVSQAPARLKEALKLGFGKAITPQGRGESGERALPTEALRHIADLVAGIASGAPRRGGGRPRAVRYEEEV